MKSSRYRTPAATMVTRETTMSMIGPPPMPSPFFRASEKVPKNTSVSLLVPPAMTSVTPSVAETKV